MSLQVSHGDLKVSLNRFARVLEPSCRFGRCRQVLKAHLSTCEEGMKHTRLAIERLYSGNQHPLPHLQSKPCKKRDVKMKA